MSAPENNYQLISDDRSLIVDEENTCWNTQGMYYREFPSDPNLIRYYTIMIINKAPEHMKEKCLLEQQVSEIIKNAIYHGNKKDKNKIVKIWYIFKDNLAKIIVEDQGAGFKELERWKKFHKERNQAFQENDPLKMMQYVSFRSDTSTEEDGGNSLFAAVEYWNGGMIYNSKKNKVCVMKWFKKPN
ncbi:MAG TPA: ATP-binding protein [Spirochaetota bacterium]|nr:ATP-binding protein [Spirochaetota bacterium]